MEPDYTYEVQTVDCYDCGAKAGYPCIDPRYSMVDRAMVNYHPMRYHKLWAPNHEWERYHWSGSEEDCKVCEYKSNYEAKYVIIDRARG